MESNWGVKAFVYEREVTETLWQVQVVMESGNIAKREIATKEELDALLEEFRVSKGALVHRGIARKQLQQ